MNIHAASNVGTRMMEGANPHPPQAFKPAGSPRWVRAAWLMQPCRSSDRTSKTFPFAGSGLACRHAVIRYRQPGQLDGNRERREHRQQGIG
jgi:hypothetical protein